MIQEAALADDESEIVRLLEALNGTDPAEIPGRSVDIDAAIWISRALRWGADMGLNPYVSTLILSETLNEIRVASWRNDRRSARVHPRRSRAIQRAGGGSA
jgi:hypothetical protein